MIKSHNPDSPSSDDPEFALIKIIEADCAVLRARAAKRSRAIADDDVDPTLTGHDREKAIHKRAS
jgi:hypothetical protein